MKSKRQLMQTYHFARFNFIAPRQDKNKFIYNSLTASISKLKGNFKYGFFDIKSLEKNSDKFIFGKLVKYKPTLKSNSVDEDHRCLIESELPMGVIASSEFFLHLYSNVLAYRPRARIFSQKQFRKMFSFLFEEAHNGFFVNTELRPITEEMEILEAFKTLTTIRKIIVNCRSTNPSNRDVYKSLDDKLKNLNAANYKQELIGGSGGLKIDELQNNDIYKAIVMAIDGYGKGIIEGEQDGRKIMISTDESPVKMEVAVSDDPTTTLENLIITFKQIWKRSSK